MTTAAQPTEATTEETDPDILPSRPEGGTALVRAGLPLAEARKVLEVARDRLQILAADSGIRAALMRTEPLVEGGAPGALDVILYGGDPDRRWREAYYISGYIDGTRDGRRKA
jgi:hypothetical protein